MMQASNTLIYLIAAANFKFLFYSAQYFLNYEAERKKQIIANRSFNVVLMSISTVHCAQKFDKWSVLLLIFSGLYTFIDEFSMQYLKFDEKFLRFYALMTLSHLALVLMFGSENSYHLLAAWEILGICSVLLIGLYFERPEPVRNALRVWCFYQFCDLFFILFFFFLRAEPHSSYLGIFLILSILAKSGVPPFCYAVARSIEGPTPSSALFYTGVSIHAGIFVLIKMQNTLETNPVSLIVLMIIGLLSACLNFLTSSTRSDIKTKIIYQSLGGVGLILILISQKCFDLAFAVAVIHMIFRVRQLIISPSIVSKSNVQDRFHLKEKSFSFLGKLSTEFLFLNFFDRFLGLNRNLSLNHFVVILLCFWGMVVWLSVHLTLRIDVIPLLFYCACYGFAIICFLFLHVRLRKRFGEKLSHQSSGLYKVGPRIAKLYLLCVLVLINLPLFYSYVVHEELMNAFLSHSRILGVGICCGFAVLSYCTLKSYFQIFSGKQLSALELGEFDISRFSYYFFLTGFCIVLLMHTYSFTLELMQFG